MNEKAIQNVISEYAMEVANYRVIIATLQQEKEELEKNNETIQEEK